MPAKKPTEIDLLREQVARMQAHIERLDESLSGIRIACARFEERDENQKREIERRHKVQSMLIQLGGFLIAVLTFIAAYLGWLPQR